MKQTNIRIKNLELRSTKYIGGPNTRKSYLEIVCWSDKPDPNLALEEFCWTIASWDTEEEPNLRFIGDRPLHKNIDRNLFWELVELGYKILNYQAEEN